LLLAVLVVGGQTAPDTIIDQTCLAGDGNCQGYVTRGSVLLQVGRGSINSTSMLPELPPPFLGPSDSHVPALVQREWSQRDSPSAAELEHFQLLKNLRTRGYQCKSKYFSGLPNTEATFKFDCRLWRAARSWSSQMGSQNFFSHVQGDSNPCKRTAEQGLGACGENIAAGNDSPSGTLEQWKQSDGHCVNMMNPEYNRFGVGYVLTSGSQYKHYWTQSIGTDGQAPDQSCLRGSSPGPAPTRRRAPPAAAPPRRRQAAAGACPKTCHGQDCNYWIQNSDNSCAVMQKTYGCDCSGCSSCTGASETSGEQGGSGGGGGCADDPKEACSSYGAYCKDYAHIRKACPRTCGVCR